MSAQERYTDEEHMQEFEQEQTPPADDRVSTVRDGGTADLIRPPAAPENDEALGHAPEGEAPTGIGGTPSAEPAADQEERTPLLPEADVARFRQDWESVQVGFVDDPRSSVARADQLVAGLMREMAESFARARASLEAEWDRGEDVSTEELRLALQRYRSFFQRLLAA